MREEKEEKERHEAQQRAKNLEEWVCRVCYVGNLYLLRGHKLIVTQGCCQRIG